MNDMIGEFTSLSEDVQPAYEHLRKIMTSDQDRLRKMDGCVQISNFIIFRTSSRLDGGIPEKNKRKIGQKQTPSLP